LGIVKTSSARSKIRAWFKKERRGDNIIMGKAAVDAEIKRHARHATETQKEAVAAALASRMGFSSTEDFYCAIGYGGLSISKFLKRLQDECDRTIKPPVEETVSAEIAKPLPISKPKNVKSNSGIIVDGEAGCMVKFAKCCNPLPGDAVIGFVTKGFGISIHKQDCPNVKEVRQHPENADRWKNAYWEIADDRVDNHSIYEALLQIHADDRIGMLADITAILADMRVSIMQVGVVANNQNRAIINLKVGCRNIEHYYSIVSRMRSLDGVNDITRGFA
jgi:GTP pyrophosphokinase